MDFPFARYRKLKAIVNLTGMHILYMGTDHYNGEPMIQFCKIRDERPRYSITQLYDGSVYIRGIFKGEGSPFNVYEVSKLPLKVIDDIIQEPLPCPRECAYFNSCTNEKLCDLYCTNKAEGWDVEIEQVMQLELAEKTATTLNLLTGLEAVKEALTKMESDVMFSYSGNTTFANAFDSITNEEMIKDFVQSYKEMHDKNPEYMPVATVYGTGGIHRYYVNFNGDVYFSAMHAAEKEFTLKAKALGFKIN